MNKIKILIPVYNDWKSLKQLLKNIDHHIKIYNNEISIIVVNDASSEEMPEFDLILNNINSIKIINMKLNQGHARCIATGIKYIFEREDFDYIIPMDGDGEDRPEELKLFLEKSKDFPENVITANRVKRSENLIFKICYQIHKIMTFIFTGKSIKFGNFTMIPKLVVEKLVNEKASWNSFSGSLCKVSNNLKSIPSIRGTRYFGPSKMSFLNLINHSLSIISVFKFTWLIRSIVFIIIYCYLISQNISLITLIPVIVLLILNIQIFKLATRENIEQYGNSLSNILNTKNVKQ
tara:strand:- start:764 stop:1639 length:876 start_codon:yes stop_codon:yes gene_type:complete